MRNLVPWIKANPLTLAAVLVTVAGVLVLVFTHLGGGALVETMQKQEGMIQQINRYMSQSVSVPPEKPSDPPRNVSGITINRAAIEGLQGLYGRIDGEFTRIFDRARQINAAGREVMQPQIFPEITNNSAPFNAKTAYLRAIESMLRAPSADARGPRLNAAPPLPNAKLEEAIREVEAQYRQQFGLAAATPLTQEQVDEVRRRQESRLRGLLLQHAQTINLYAQTDLNAADFPFEVAPWARASEPPSVKDLWNGQMNLWIQQDIATAIAIANRVGESDANVYSAPVKQLVKVDVVTGPVGIKNHGAILGGEVQSASATPGGDPNAGAPPATADRRLDDNFGVAPTGRASNPLYDVWHVTVELVVDNQQLPQLFAAINSVNFMTVLTVDVEDVDEYAALQQGYVFGAGDASKVRLVIETIWLRDFTTRWMPGAVKDDLGIPRQPS